MTLEQSDAHSHLSTDPRPHRMLTMLRHNGDRCILNVREFGRCSLCETGQGAGQSKRSTGPTSLVLIHLRGDRRSSSILVSRDPLNETVRHMRHMRHMVTGGQHNRSDATTLRATRHKPYYRTLAEHGRSGVRSVSLNPEPSPCGAVRNCRGLRRTPLPSERVVQTSKMGGASPISKTDNRLRHIFSDNLKPTSGSNEQEGRY